MYLFILTIFRFLLGSSEFECVLLLQREKQSQSRHFELFPRYTKDFDPGHRLMVKLCNGKGMGASTHALFHNNCAFQRITFNLHAQVHVITANESSP